MFWPHFHPAEHKQEFLDTAVSTTNIKEGRKCRLSLQHLRQNTPNPFWQVVQLTKTPYVGLSFTHLYKLENLHLITVMLSASWHSSNMAPVCVARFHRKSSFHTFSLVTYTQPTTSPPPPVNGSLTHINNPNKAFHQMSAYETRRQQHCQRCGNCTLLNFIHPSPYSHLLIPPLVCLSTDLDTDKLHLFLPFSSVSTAPFNEGHPRAQGR